MQTFERENTIMWEYGKNGIDNGCAQGVHIKEKTAVAQKSHCNGKQGNAKRRNQMPKMREMPPACRKPKETSNL